MRNMLYKGRAALEGKCTCGQQLIIVLPVTDGAEFESFHQLPACDDYNAIVKNAKSKLVALSLAAIASGKVE